MPPVKVPKKALKSMEPGGGLIPKKKKDGKKMSRKNYDSFSIYLFKVLKSCTEINVGISRKSILIMNNFVNDILEQIACEAGRLIAHGKKTTLSENEIRTATKLLIPGELGKHALLEGEKALRNYKNNSSSQSY
ncbi:late histone H2B.L4-like [Cydia pomonella]|uniref:late histone H2B.L4-like n=1 Tax=Cydia pomonella TaxID=82600 RepID=UPI002ADE5FEE|nr:late histone H2B.L4-like [Cydia pomonella]